MILSLLASLAAIALGPAVQQIADSRTALVTVTDQRTRFIVDLGPADFVMPDRGRPRGILVARMADYPVAVLIDHGAAAAQSFDDMREAVGKFIARLGPRPIALGTLGDPPAIVATLDDDRKVLSERLDALTVKPGADTVTMQAAADAARTLRSLGSRFSALVVVSGSPIDTSRLTPDELIPPIVDSGAVVHAVVNRAGPEAPMAGGMDTVRRLSDQTHGQFTPIYSAASYQVALNRLADRLASEIMIEYIVPPRSAATDIQVGVRIPGARARGLGVRPR